MSLYSFRSGPEYRGATREEMIVSAMDQPMSLTSTFFDQAKGGILESFGLGTAIRGASLPEEAPTEPGLTTRGPNGETINLPDTPQMRRRQVQQGITAPQETADQLERRRRDVGALSEDAYKSSPWFRPNIPWDAGMTEDRAASLAMWDDAKRVREHYASKRPITAFIGNLAGQAFDPINYVPVAGPLVKAAAVARAGKIGGAAVASALDAAGNTALAGLATRDARSAFGDDVSWQTTVSEIATAALIGGAFGSIAGALGRRTDAKTRAAVDERLSTLKTTQEARIALNEGIDAMVRGEDVSLTPNATEPLARVAGEVNRLSRAYDEVRANPTGGPRDPLVQITPEDIEGTIVARGAFKKHNEADVKSRAGWGLVKIIWRHGDPSDEPKEFQIAKEDVTDLPNVIREYDPSSVSADGARREWRVERDGRTIVYADALMPEGRHVVTAYVQRPDRPGADAVLSEKRKPAAAGSSSDVFSAIQDTNRGLNPQRTDGQPHLPATRNIGALPAVDNSAARPEPAPDGRAQAETRIAKPDDYKALAAQYQVDPETGSFIEDAEIAQLEIEGRLTEADVAVLADAQATFEDGAAYGEALKSVANCLI